MKTVATSLLACLALVGCVEQAPESASQPPGTGGKGDDASETSAQQRAVAKCDGGLAERLAEAETDEATGNAYVDWMTCLHTANDESSASIVARVPENPTNYSPRAAIWRFDSISEKTCFADLASASHDEFGELICMGQRARDLAALISAHMSFGADLARPAIAAPAERFADCYDTALAPALGDAALAACLLEQTRDAGQVILGERGLEPTVYEELRAEFETAITESTAITDALCTIFSLSHADAPAVAAACKRDAAALLAVELVGPSE